MLSVANKVLFKSETTEDMSKLCTMLDELCILHHKTPNNGVIVHDCESSMLVSLAQSVNLSLSIKDLSRTVAFMLLDTDIPDEIEDILSGVDFYPASKRVFYVDEWNALRAKLILLGAHIQFTQSRAEYFSAVSEVIHSA